MDHITLTIDGADYVAIPAAAYARLTGTPAPGLAGTDAAAYARQRIGTGLKAARRHAGLTQAALATALGTTQGGVANIEAGRTRIGAGLVGRWMRACGLPVDWQPG